MGTGDTMASERLRLSLTTDTVDTEATVVDTEAMVDTFTAGATTASVRLMPNPRLLLSLTTDTVDTEATEDMAMEDMVDIVLEVTEASEVSVMAMASNLFPNCP